MCRCFPPVCLEARGRCLVSSSISASPCSFKKGLSLKQKLATLTKLAGQRALAIWNLWVPVLVLQLQAHTSMPSFSHGARDLISDPCACKASTLSHGAPFQLPFFLWFNCFCNYVLFSLLTEEIFLWLISCISAIFLWAVSSTPSTWIATSY